jgi:methionyl aminopeptidase
VNHVVCHGIPGDRRLKKGDIVNIDITVIKDGWHGDTSRMFFVGEPTVIGRRVSEVSHEAMRRGHRDGRAGRPARRHRPRHPAYVEAQGCSVVREYCGHGIGREFHEDPQVLHYGKPGTGWSSSPA